ncbi:hypothetical protein FOZ60_006794 [Perkinsus olseni]|uniref:Eukaryotic peptide chain release factor subunit 1 n=1 Tax=Perkinsus olseni TaxID=32597 RepID=A0A7J6NNY7_PEROL|nr:hypothetical protein FOZ60_006794 [Perkinsus olseni]
MKLELKQIEKDGSGRVVVIPEESEDIWHLYNLVSVIPIVSSVVNFAHHRDRRTNALITWYSEATESRPNTVRKVSKETSSGSVSSEKRHLRLTIAVTAVDYDGEANIIRYNCPRDAGTASPSIYLMKRPISLFPVWRRALNSSSRIDLKDGCRLVRDVSANAELAVVLIDSGLANLYLLTRVLAKEMAKVSVNIPKKRSGSSGYDKALNKFYDQVYVAIKQHVDFDKVKCIVIAGPGFVRDDFIKYAREEATKKADSQMLNATKNKFVSCHCSTAYKQGLNELMQDETVKSQVADTKAMSNVAALDRFYTMLKNDPERAVYGPGPVTKAAEMGAIDELLITDGLFRSSSVGVRKRYVALVEEVQATSNVFIFSTQHVSGEQLQNLAGIAATLKFPCPDLDDEYALTEQEALGSSDDEDRDGTAGKLGAR